MTADRAGCCAGWPKPCSYHEGWQDALDAARVPELLAERDALIAQRSEDALRYLSLDTESQELFDELKTCRAERDAALTQLAQLRAALEDALGHFFGPCHPGFNAVRGHPVEVGRYERWRALLGSHPVNPEGT